MLCVVLRQWRLLWHPGQMMFIAPHLDEHLDVGSPPAAPPWAWNTLQQGADRLWRRKKEWESRNPVQVREKVVFNVSGVHQRAGQESAVRWGKVRWAVRVGPRSVSPGCNHTVLGMAWKFFQRTVSRGTGSLMAMAGPFIPISFFCIWVFPGESTAYTARGRQGQVQQPDVIAFSSTIAPGAEPGPFCACLSPHNES